jgi:hypothetical protein
VGYSGVPTLCHSLKTEAPSVFEQRICSELMKTRFRTNLADLVSLCVFMEYTHSTAFQRSLPCGFLFSDLGLATELNILQVHNTRFLDILSGNSGIVSD